MQLIFVIKKGIEIGQAEALLNSVLCIGICNIYCALAILTEEV